MRYICLGYMEESRWDAMTQSERDAFVAECVSYDEELRTSGYMVGGEALRGVHTATTLRYRNGRLAITDGPFAETKEQLGGILILEAADLNHAIQLMSRHPSVRHGGSWEVRPADEETNALSHTVASAKAREANKMGQLIERVIDISAPVDRVWNVLIDPRAVETWSREFWPGGDVHLEADFRVGGAVVMQDENGDGLAGRVTHYRPEELLRIEYDAALHGGVPDPNSKDTQDWKGLSDTYRLSRSNGDTSLAVATTIPGDWDAGEFSIAWDRALNKIKEMAEK